MFGNSDDDIYAIEAGMSCFSLKPFTLAAVAQKLKELKITNRESYDEIITRLLNESNKK